MTTPIPSIKVTSLKGQPNKLVEVDGRKGWYDVVEFQRTEAEFDVELRGPNPVFRLNHWANNGTLTAKSQWYGADDAAAAIRVAIKQVTGKAPNALFKAVTGNERELRIDTDDADELVGVLKELRDAKEILLPL